MSRAAKDSGVAVAPATRTSVFGGQMPAANPATDAGVATATTARPDTRVDLDPPVVTVARGSS